MALERLGDLGEEVVRLRQDLGLVEREVDLVLDLELALADEDELLALVRAAVVVGVAVDDLGLGRAPVGRVGDAVHVVVRIRAAVFVLILVDVLGVVRAAVAGVGDAVLVVVALRAAVLVGEAVEVLLVVGTAVDVVRDAVAVAIRVGRRCRDRHGAARGHDGCRLRVGRPEGEGGEEPVVRGAVAVHQAAPVSGVGGEASADVAAQAAAQLERRLGGAGAADLARQLAEQPDRDGSRHRAHAGAAAVGEGAADLEGALVHAELLALPDAAAQVGRRDEHLAPPVGDEDRRRGRARLAAELGVDRGRHGDHQAGAEARALAGAADEVALRADPEIADAAAVGALDADRRVHLGALIEDERQRRSELDAAEPVGGRQLGRGAAAHDVGHAIVVGVDHHQRVIDYAEGETHGQLAARGLARRLDGHQLSVTGRDRVEVLHVEVLGPDRAVGRAQRNRCAGGRKISDPALRHSQMPPFLKPRPRGSSSDPRLSGSCQASFQ